MKINVDENNTGSRWLSAFVDKKKKKKTYFVPQTSCTGLKKYEGE